LKLQIIFVNFGSSEQIHFPENLQSSGLKQQPLDSGSLGGNNVKKW